MVVRSFAVTNQFDYWRTSPNSFPGATCLLFVIVLVPLERGNENVSRCHKNISCTSATSGGIIVFAMGYSGGRSAVFEPLRKRLFAIAYRRLGTAADAEDMN
jgi:hypothetical protein